MRQNFINLNVNKKIYTFNHFGTTVETVFTNDSEIHQINTFMAAAQLMSSLSHCSSKKVAALIVKNNRIISTGINGTLPGTTNCDDVFGETIVGDIEREKHHEWSLLNELHAESNAIAEAAKNGICIDGADMYITLSPCVNCIKLIIAAGIKRIFFHELYDKYADNIGNINDMLSFAIASKVKMYQVK